MKSSPLRLALLALALTAGRASADLGCVSTLSQAGPHGELCHGSSGPHPQQQAQPTGNPAASGQLVNMAAGMMGTAAGALVTTPLSNPYQGHQAVKPVVTDDDGIKTPGTGAAGDIIGSYKPSEDESYADRLAHFRELHDAEMDQRRAALEKLKGTSAEKWCAAHIGILFPEPPVSNVVNSYPNNVRAYDREKQIWDKRCGGPSAQEGYQGFTDELAGLKPDAPAAAPVAGTTKAPTYEAPEPPPTAAPAAAPEKPGDDFADAEKELEGPPAKKSAAAPAPEAPSSDQSPPSDVGAAPDSAPSPDDSKNTNRTTEFFGEKNAKVTAKDLADSRAPELQDIHAGAQGFSGGSGSAGGAKTAPHSSAPSVAGPGEVAVVNQTPRMLSTHGLKDIHMEPMIQLRSGSDDSETPAEASCATACSDALDDQSTAMEKFHKDSAEFPKAAVMGHVEYAKAQAKKAVEKNLEDMRDGKYGDQEDPTGLPSDLDFKECGVGICANVTDKAAAAGTPSIGHDKKGSDTLNPFATTTSNALKLFGGTEKPRQPALVWMKSHMVTFDDIAAAREAEALLYASGRYNAVRTSLLENPYFQQMAGEYKEKIDGVKEAYETVRDYIHETKQCLDAPGDAYDQCMKAQDKGFGKGIEALKETSLGAAATRVEEAAKAYEPYVGNLLHTSETLIKKAAHCLGGCP